MITNFIGDIEIEKIIAIILFCHFKTFLMAMEVTRLKKKKREKYAEVAEVRPLMLLYSV